MRAGSVRTSSIVLSYSFIPLAATFSLMWWNDNRNDFSSRVHGPSRSFSWPRNALHSRSRLPRVYLKAALSSARKASSIASSSVICAASMAAVFVSAVAAAFVSSVVGVVCVCGLCPLVYRRSRVACRVQRVSRVGNRRLSSSVVVCCVFAVICASRLSLCLLTVLCSAFRLKIRLRAPFVVKLRGSHLQLIKAAFVAVLETRSVGSTWLQKERERNSNCSLRKAKNINKN